MAENKDSRRRLLMVEDDELFRRTMGKHLEKYYRVIAAADASEAVERLAESAPDVVLLDLMLGRESGLDVLEHLRGRAQPPPVVVLSALDRIPEVVSAVKAGASDYLAKPVQPEQLLLTLERVIEAAEMRGEVERRRHLQIEANRGSRLIGESAQVVGVRREIERIGPSGATVLICGETGTGKELVARGLHAASERASGPFVAVNCGAVPRDLFEAEFFGHKKGAFTGAQAGGVGKFQLAHRGTLLLDEVGELPLESQVKLLRAIEEQEFYPVGSSELVRVEVRILASTHRDLEEMVEEGEFREDLFFRLDVYRLELPPLRERGRDVILLARHLIEEAGRRGRAEPRELSPEAEEVLLSHAFRGNVRELANAIERVILVGGEGPIQAEELAFLTGSRRAEKAARGGDLELPDEGVDLDQLEKKLMIQALERAGGNKSQAARLLNLTPATFYYRMDKYGLGGDD